MFRFKSCCLFIRRQRLLFDLVCRPQQQCIQFASTSSVVQPLMKADYDDNKDIDQIEQHSNQKTKRRRNINNNVFYSIASSCSSAQQDPVRNLEELSYLLNVQSPSYSRIRNSIKNDHSNVEVRLNFQLPNNKLLEYRAQSHSYQLAVLLAAQMACRDLKERFALFDDKSNISKSNVDYLRNATKRNRNEHNVFMAENHPKALIHNLFELAKQKPKAKAREQHEATKINTRQHISIKTRRLDSGMWETQCNLKWPSDLKFTAQGELAPEAERKACYKALLQLRKLGYFNNYFLPRLFDQSEWNRLRSNWTKRSEVNITPELRCRLESIVTQYEKLKEEMESFMSRAPTEFCKIVANRLEEYPFQITEALRAAKESIEKPDEEGAQSILNEERVMMNIVTGRSVGYCSDEDLKHRSEMLLETHERYMSSVDNDQSLNIRQQRMNLPIAKSRDEICSLLHDNQVVVVVGDTGSGKSTQVPQFLFEDALMRGDGARCNIIISQPRRISAVSLASRVARERGEKVGETVGFHVRLNREHPESNGAMLFVTPAMLVRLMEMNKDMTEVSHIILDEVHERDIWTDCLFLLVKDVLKKKPHIKLLLMSASMDTQKIARYFDNCPIVNVKGRKFPVKDHFIEDFHPSSLALRGQEIVGLKQIEDVAAQTILNIHDTKPPGAILCFLPSWGSIAKVHNLLEKSADSAVSNLLIFRCHSRLPIQRQQHIFDEPPAGVRKVILATNVAETSITINDVVYVVNSGLQKEILQDGEDVSGSMSQVGWGSKSSQLQRKGRAGRLSPGECFHLFSRNTFNKMLAQPQPEIITSRLDSFLLTLKLFFPTEDPRKRLQNAMDCPSEQSVKESVHSLVELGLIDGQTETLALTPLGWRLAHFGCSSQISKVLFYAAFFRCLSSVVSVMAKFDLNNKDVIKMGFENKRVALKVIEQFACNSLSDFVSDVNMCNSYSDASRTLLSFDPTLPGSGLPNGEQFIENNYFDTSALYTVSGLRKLYLSQLTAAGFLSTNFDVSNTSTLVKQNEHSNCEGLMTGVILAGMNQNLACSFKGTVGRDGHLNPEAVELFDEFANKVYPTKLSAISCDIDPPSPWFTYCFKLRDPDSGGQRKVSSVSMLHPLAPLLFAVNNWKPVPGNNYAVKMSSNQKFRISFASVHEKDLLFSLRSIIDQLVSWFAMDLEHVFGKIDQLKLQNELRQLEDDVTLLVADLLSTESTTIHESISSALDEILSNCVGSNNESANKER